MAGVLPYLKLAASAGMIAWGAEHFGRLIIRPELASSWIGVLAIVGGAGYGAWTAYRARRGAPLLGTLLLAAAGAWAWNAQFYFDPERFPGSEAPGPPLGSYLAFGVLLLLGIFFAVFFRYLLPSPTTTVERETTSGPPPGRTEAAEAEAPVRSPHPPEAKPQGPRTTPWYRLGLVAASAAIAIVAGRLSGIEEPGRTRLTLLVLVLGSLATGLISEETLVKLVPGRKK